MKSEQIENLEEQTNILFKIGNKLEQRIAKLEKFWRATQNVLER